MGRKAKFTPEQAEVIRSNTDATLEELAVIHGTTRLTIWKVKNRKPPYGEVEDQDAVDTDSDVEVA